MGAHHSGGASVKWQKRVRAVAFFGGGALALAGDDLVQLLQLRGREG
jgi:hypothetical protein